MSPRKLDKAALLEAFDTISEGAVAHDARLEIAVYGGSALILAGNFRFTAEDVDIAEISSPWPRWLREVVARLAERRGWSDDWLNEAVTVHLSANADRAADHVAFGSFAREGTPGLVVSVPTADYMLALKLTAMRTLVGVDTDGAMALLARYFPKTGADDSKQRFLLKHLAPSAEVRSIDAPVYPR